MKKTCDNCADYIVCWGMSEAQKEVCDEWEISYDAFEQYLQEKGITKISEIEDVVRKNKYE